MSIAAAGAATLNGYASTGRTPDVALSERALLGAAIGGSSVISAQRAAEAMIEILPTEDLFSEAAHQAVYAAVRYLAEAGESITPQAVLARLVATEHGAWRTGQAGVILDGLMAAASPSYEHDARRVLRAGLRRRGLLALQRGMQVIAETPDDDFDEIPERVRRLLEDAFSVSIADEPVTAADLFLDVVARIESGKPPGTIPLPWEDLQRLTGLLRPGQLVTVAARPSLGKSLMGQDIARHVAIKEQIPVILFTMEQDREEVMDRLVAAEAGVLLDRITNSNPDADEWVRIACTEPQFAASKLVIDDTPRITLAHIRARLRGMARNEPAKLAIIDYLQLMDGLAGENRQREVASAVSGLKAIAREFHIPVIMLCQLNRGPEGRADKRPYISDARESGAVENDSDIAILIHRPDHYEPESERAGEADFIVDKNRNGARRTVTVGFQGHYARFVDLTHRQEPSSS